MDARPRTARDPPCGSASSASGGSARMHAELLARRVPGAAVARGLRRLRRRRRAPSAPALGVPVAGVGRRAARRARRRRRRDLHVHRHPRRPDRRGGARPARRSSARSRCRSTSPRSTARWPPSRPPASRSRSASTAASTPRTRRSARRSPPADVGDPHLVRITSRDPAPPPIEYVRVSGGIFLDMTIHDFDMARYVTGSEVVEVYARGAVRVDPAFGEAGDVDTAMVMLEHENGCLTAIDNSRQAVYGYDQRVEVFGSAGMAASREPARAQRRIVRTADGRARGDAALLLPRALHPELPARVGGVRRRARRRRDAAGHDGRRARAARHRPRRVALAARGPARAHRGGGGVTRARTCSPTSASTARSSSSRAALGRRLRPDRPRALRRARRPGRGGGGMRIWVTGASGFVGSNLVHVFAERHGAEVVAPGHETSTSPTRRPCAARSPRARPTRSSTPRSGTLRRARARPSRARGPAYVGATRNVVDAANAAGVPVVLVSTDWVFDGTQGPAAEDAPPNPVNAYGFLKAASRARRHRARARGIVARIAAVQGVHRARAGGAARAGRRLRLLRRRARRHAARRRALHGLGRPGPQRARHADARDRRRPS